MSVGTGVLVGVSVGGTRCISRRGDGVGVLVDVAVGTGVLVGMGVAVGVLVRSE